MEIKCKECGNGKTFTEVEQRQDLFHEYILKNGKTELVNEDLGGSYGSEWFCTKCENPLTEKQSKYLTKNK